MTEPPTIGRRRDSGTEEEFVNRERIRGQGTDSELSEDLGTEVYIHPMKRNDQYGIQPFECATIYNR